jgi:hypothetical protein
LINSGPQRAAKEILRYFVRNPEAADTLEGIARWRLLEEVAHRTVTETSAALGQLLARGLLQQTFSPGIGPIFSFDRRKIRQANEFLEKAETKQLAPERRSPG